jgi:hypothetical protein
MVGRRLRRGLTASVVLVGLWGIGGGIQMRSTGHGGYHTGLGVGVVQVDGGGPAEASGLAVGDQIVAVDGIAVARPWSKPNLAPVGIGNTQTLRVDRAGTDETVEVRWERIPPDRWRSFMIDFVVTVAWLGFGLWAMLASGSASGTTLAVLGLTYGLANLRGPSLGAIDDGISFLQQNLSVFLTAVLCYFLVVFPRPKRMARRRIPGWLVYALFLPLLLFGLAEWVVFPAGVSEYRTVLSLTDLFYMVMSLVALIHTWIALSGDERRRTGFSWILWGLACAIGPFLALALLRTVFGAFPLPGEGYLPLLGALIPGSMALAVVTESRSRETSESHQDV